MKPTLYIFLLLITLLAGSKKILAQTTVKNSIIIINNKSPEKETFYKESIYKANMEPYRLKEKNDTVKFAEGFQCVILAAKQLAATGITIDADLYQSNFVYNYRKPEFSITEDGHLIATYIKVSK